MEIVNIYRETMPASRFVGIRYSMVDMEGGTFAGKWQEWFAQKRFEALDALLSPAWKDVLPEPDSSYGLMRWDEQGTMEYWIGIFAPPDATPPAEYAVLDYPDMELGVCWLKGKPPEIFCREEEALRRMTAEGFDILGGADRPQLLLERYQCPRFTAPDENGDVMLDLCAWIAPAAEEDPAGKSYCGNCYMAYAGGKCPDCGREGTPLAPDDPIFIGELPGPLRNALQIAFSARDIPFTALPHMGSGFTMAAGDLLETWRVYAPFSRSAEAKAAMDGLLVSWRTSAGNAQQ